MANRKDDPMGRTTARILRLAAGTLLLLAVAAPGAALEGQRDELLTKLHSAEPAVRAAAATDLAPVAARDLESVLPALQSALRDPVAEVRLASSTTLKVAAMASEDNARLLRRATPELIARLADASPAVRGEAASALTAVRPHTPAEAAPALLSLFADADAEVRQAALGAVGGLAATTPTIEAALVATLHRDPAAPVRGEAARALGRLPGGGAAVVEGLLTALDDADPYVRRQAVRALGRLGSAAHSAVDVLVGIARDPQEDPDLRAHAVYALRSIGGVQDRELPDPSELRSDVGRPHDLG